MARKQFLCEECLSSVVKRIYMRELVAVPLSGLEPERIRGLRSALKHGNTTRSVQRFLPLGLWCQVCGWVKIERQTYNEQREAEREKEKRERRPRHPRKRSRRT